MTVGSFIALARELGAAKIGPGDPILSDITEGRFAAGSGYAWCGDEVTYLLARSGAACDPRFVNRYECGRTRAPDNGIGLNISKLVSAGVEARTILYGGAAALRIRNNEALGDVFVLQNSTGGHVGVVLDYLGEGHFTTSDGNSLNGRTAINRRRLGPDLPLYAVIPGHTFFGAESKSELPFDGTDPGWLAHLSGGLESILRSMGPLSGVDMGVDSPFSSPLSVSAQEILYASGALTSVGMDLWRKWPSGSPTPWPIFSDDFYNERNLA